MNRVFVQTSFFKDSVYVKKKFIKKNIYKN